LNVKSTTFGADLTIKTPLFQTNLFPDFMHVNDLLETTDLSPAFLHVPPALVAAFAGIRGRDKMREDIAKNATSLLFIFSYTLLGILGWHL
jgi:hypothetical protein